MLVMLLALALLSKNFARIKTPPSLGGVFVSMINLLIVISSVEWHMDTHARIGTKR